MNDNLEALRHTASHVMAAAVYKLMPDTKFGIGPAIENGFYYDFDLPKPISEADLPKIEAEMQKIIAADLPVEQAQVPRDEALKAASVDQPYKKELIEEISDDPISFYRIDQFIDLCKGPHVKSTSEIKAFKLLSLAGSYWKGSEKNKMLTRIYGTAFGSQKELDDYLNQLEEAKKRDHRKLGKELGLFITPEIVGPGLPIWLPKGTILRETLQNYLRAKQVERGYQPVITPHIAKEELFKVSGHIPHYLESMFNPLEIEKEKYYLKPVNCPFHIQVYKNETRSYRDLPIRLAEFGTVYRYEKSGELNGLTRVRSITQDDAHIFCRHDQLQQEFLSTLKLILEIFDKLKFTDYRARIGVRGQENKEKYLGDDKSWEKAEADIVKAVKESGLQYSIEEGDAAIYGPKLDFIVKDVLGRSWQLGTIQVDYNMPEGFDLTYINEKGQNERPVIIHRAPFGSLERFVGILIEHFGGDFPLWLAPEQIRIIPVSEKSFEPSCKLFSTLQSQGYRVDNDMSNDTLGKKIRRAELEKIPYILIVGPKEIEKSTDKELWVSVRSRQKGDLGLMPLEKFISQAE